jgi:hypothetical protein
MAARSMSVTPAVCDVEDTCALIMAMKELCHGHRAIDIIAASHSLTAYVVANSSFDLPSALNNADKLCADMKEELRRRLAN